MTNDEDDGLKWTDDIIGDEDFEDLMDKADIIISNEEKVFHFTLELSVKEAVNLVRQWNQALNGNAFMINKFNNIITDYAAFLESSLGDMGIDPDDYDKE